MLSTTQIDCLRDAFQEILGAAAPGTMCYIRCLALNIIASICASEAFNIHGWDVFSVTDYSDKQHRLITGDQAVEIREDKNQAVLLLVDSKTAGAGMDGIYSAAREIREKEFFDKANDYARKNTPRGFQVFTGKAIKKARRVGGQNTISPWEEFIFYSSCVDKESISKSLAGIGLWPINFMGRPQDGDLDKAAQLVERLLIHTKVDATAESKVDALILHEPTLEQIRDLTRIIHESMHQSCTDTLLSLKNYPHLWLNNLRPGIFDLDTLKKIEIVPWRTRGAKPAAWSGLILIKGKDEKDDQLHFILDPDAKDAKKQSKLEIRWKSLPDDLTKGAVDYVIAIQSGDENIAEKSTSHTGKNPQKCTFTIDDFDLDETAKFEAVVSIYPVGNEEIRIESEDFILRFGDAAEGTKSSIGKVYRSLVEGMISLNNQLEFDNACMKYRDSAIFGLDSKNYINFRFGGKRARIFYPPLIKKLESDFFDKQGQIGRWVVRVRSDGSQVDNPKFIPIAPRSRDASWDRITTVSRYLSQYIQGTQGFLGVIYRSNRAFEDYVNAWNTVIEISEPSLALANTLEVRSITGAIVGIIVLPFHFLRIAWHQAYDTLLQNMRYDETISEAKIREIISSIDGAHFPAFLPGLEKGTSFVFADMLGFYAAAMVPDHDKEPKASVAILAKALAGDKEDIAPSIGKTTSDVLAQEISRYISLHQDYETIRLCALRPGDGMTIGRSLGVVHKNLNNSGDEEEVNRKNTREFGFYLELYPSEDNLDISGKFFGNIAEQKRTGAGYVPEDDKWILDPYQRDGDISMPRLRWAKRSNGQPTNAAHLSVAFDTFDSRVKLSPTTEIENNSPLEVYGIIANINRLFSFAPHAQWRTFIAPQIEGEKHPMGRGFTDRLIKAHVAVMKATAANLGGTKDTWPVLCTEISSEKEEEITNLHKISDWVLTIDRNAGVEYFDSPQEKPNIYEAYIIDCIPEREDLGFLQLVTSTSNFDEVVYLLDMSLTEMGMSSSPRNCLFLLNELKGLSGRFAMRVAGMGNQSQEMIALAMTHANSHMDTTDDQFWFSLKEGFFIPIDDVPDLLPASRLTEEQSRADLIYVTVPRRGGFSFSFIEVKFRRYLNSARGIDLIKTMAHQIQSSRNRWVELYGDEANILEKTIRRSWLARILKFYANKGRRHFLNEDAYERIIKEIDRMIREGAKFLFPTAEDQQSGDRGYVFCPEYTAQKPSRISFIEQPPIHLFGAQQIPDSPARKYSPPLEDIFIEEQVFENMEVYSEESEEKKEDQQIEKLSPPDETNILLGSEFTNQEKVGWKIGIRANPHMMIVGLPGMGKTTSLINVCLQMFDRGIVPIIFSYHEDIDLRLNERLPDNVQYVDYDGLGFNPLSVVHDSPIAYIDNVSMLRDIFSSIFPDLGEIQLSKIREALKQSYTDKGWGDGVKGLELPEFQSFFDILKSQPKPDQRLLARLEELNDYGFFRNTSGAKSLLETAKICLIRVHQTQNEVLQRAFATFVLHNLYQSMFQRGTQNRITHAIIFDEAHRAAKLKLIPIMAKECRKYGLTLIVSSQEVKDFDPSLFNAIANYLALRLTENDAKIMAKIMAPSDQVKRYTDRIKQLPKYNGIFSCEGESRATVLRLDSIDNVKI